MNSRASLASFALLTLFFTLLAVGCAAVPPSPGVDGAGVSPAERLQAYTARAALLARLTDWEVEGRLALSTPEGGWQARLHWVRRRDEHRIDLAGLLGGTRLRLTQDAAGAVLRDAAHTYRDTNAERLLARALGWPVPLDGLGYWLRGLPAPDGPPPARRELDALGRLTYLSQHDWDIRYLEYARLGPYELPSKVFLERTFANGGAAADGGAPLPPPPGRLEVRLVIERWALSPRP